MIAVPTLFKAAALGVAVLSLPSSGLTAAAQEAAAEPPQLDVPYVPTRPAVVEKMLELGEVGPEDYVIDLGSGDGRILVAAARKGARGFGVDIDPQRIAEANANAKAAGVEGRVKFVRQDLFKTAINEANVLTMYLLPDVNLKLRPRILEQLKPGSRVVSHAFDMDEWTPDETVEVDGATVHLWIVPAQVAGRWTLTDAQGRRVPVEIRQTFQKVEGTVGSGGLSNARLEGNVLRFTADLGSGERLYQGQVQGRTITPITRPVTGDLPPATGWRLARVS